MRKNAGRIAATMLATGVGMGLAGGIAGAEASNPDLPVRYDAKGTDRCSVDFTIHNDTNSDAHEIDFRVDGEPLINPGVGSGDLGRLAGLKAAVHPEAPKGGYRSDAPTQTVIHTVKLGTPDQLVTLPNPLSDTHKVEYRMILGPEADHRDGDWHEVTISGCNPIQSGSAGLF
ncbi:hypothetical protein [Rhodococcus chondri]|uniref:Uncharacterized protein n=1 Tax=Rhodococcus chondri TaxID=3065941 RepID=A0ABU7JQH2_9NOCA|nr:hypothetical protein [Rhodococcus sp. CC-R104]MEE2032270.1 hypothetical protein [Rhodococcus sp. CC-R104]